MGNNKEASPDYYQQQYNNNNNNNYLSHTRPINNMILIDWLNK